MDISFLYVSCQYLLLSLVLHISDFNLVLYYELVPEWLVRIVMALYTGSRSRVGAAGGKSDTNFWDR